MAIDGRGTRALGFGDGRGRRFQPAAALALLGLLLAGCGGPASAPVVPPAADTPPAFAPGETVTVRVRWLVKRSLSENKVNTEDLAAAATELLGVPVVFADAGPAMISGDLYAAVEADSVYCARLLAADLTPAVADPRTRPAAVAKLAECYANSFKRYEFDHLLGFARRVLPPGRLQGVSDGKQLAGVVAGWHAERMVEMLAALKRNDQPVLPYVEAFAIARQPADADLFITALPIISAEDDPEIDIHTGLRGGVTFGLNGNKRTGLPPGAPPRAMVVSAYFCDPDPNLWPGDRAGWRRGVAALFAHELAHSALDLDHAYDHENCVLNPCPGTDLPAWSAALRRCPLPHRRLPADIP